MNRRKIIERKGETEEYEEGEEETGEIKQRMWEPERETKKDREGHRMSRRY